MKTAYQKNCLKLAALFLAIAIVALFFYGCGTVNRYRLPCRVIALNAGDAIEHLLNQPAYIAYGGNHVQAYRINDGLRDWATIQNGELIIGARCEMREIRADYSLKDFKYLMKEIWRDN